MNITEHLLVCLTEECAEIIKAADKALRFGLNDHYPGRDTTNLNDIVLEIHDFLGVLELLKKYKIIPEETSSYLIDTKIGKVEKYMEYAKERGTLEEG